MLRADAWAQWAARAAASPDVALDRIETLARAARNDSRHLGPLFVALQRVICAQILAATIDVDVDRSALICVALSEVKATLRREPRRGVSFLGALLETLPAALSHAVTGPGDAAPARSCRRGTRIAKFRDPANEDDDDGGFYRATVVIRPAAD